MALREQHHMSHVDKGKEGRVHHFSIHPDPPKHHETMNRLTMKTLKSHLLDLNVDEDKIDGLSFPDRKKLLSALLLKDEIITWNIEHKLQMMVQAQMDPDGSIKAPWEVPLQPPDSHFSLC